MVNCTIPGCTSNSSSPRSDVRLKNEKRVSFLGFPVKNPNLCTEWISFVRSFEGFQSWNPSKQSKICGLHFSADLMEKFGRGMTASPEMVPTIKNPPSQPLVKSRKRKNTSPPAPVNPPKKAIFEDMPSIRIAEDIPINQIPVGGHLIVIAGVAFFLSIQRLEFEKEEISSTGRVNKVARIQQCHHFEVSHDNAEYRQVPLDEDKTTDKRKELDGGYSISAIAKYTISVDEEVLDGGSKYKDLDLDEQGRARDVAAITNLVSDMEEERNEKFRDPQSILKYLLSSAQEFYSSTFVDVEDRGSTPGTDSPHEEMSLDLNGCNTPEQLASYDLDNLQIDESVLPESQHWDEVLDFNSLDSADYKFENLDDLVDSYLLANDQPNFSDGTEPQLATKR